MYAWDVQALLCLTCVSSKACGSDLKPAALRSRRWCPEHSPGSYLSRWAWQSREAAFLHALASTFWLLGDVCFLPDLSLYSV